MLALSSLPLLLGIRIYSVYSAVKSSSVRSKTKIYSPLKSELPWNTLTGALIPNCIKAALALGSTKLLNSLARAHSKDKITRQ